MSDEAPKVGVLAASPSELPIMRQAGLILEKFGVPHEIRIMSLVAEPRPGGRVRPHGVRARPQRRDLLDRDVGPPGGRRRRADDPPGDRRSDRLVAADGGERGARDHGPDADRRARRDGGRRRGRERGGARRRDRRDRRPGGAGHALEVQGRPRRRASSFDPSIQPARDGRRLVGRGPARELAGDRGPGGRGVVGAREDPGCGRTGDPRTCVVHRRTRCSRSKRSRATTSPRSSRWWPTRSGRRGAGSTSG